MIPSKTYLRAVGVVVLCSSCGSGALPAAQSEVHAHQVEDAREAPPQAQPVAEAPQEVLDETATRDAPPPAPAETLVEAPPRPNRFSRDVRVHRAAWEKRNALDYVLVVDKPSIVHSNYQGALRVVVRAGRPTAVKSLRSGSDAGVNQAPTMSTIYDDVESAAHFGERGVPTRFRVSYDKRHSVVLSFSVDPRGGVADDETSLTVHCYSVEPDGCRAHELSPAECSAIGGAVAMDGACAGIFVGSVAGGGGCCRASEERIADTACNRAGGKMLGSCGPRKTVLGRSEDYGQSCCRSLLVE